jgi:uncharacterized SAM-binding protein YcdF (DUF218 family)
MSAKEPRLVAVLGYSTGAGRDLHEVCAARLRRAELEAREGDVLLFSGWARRRKRAAEAELMARSWRGSAARVMLDRGARTTLANAVGVAAAARALQVGEVVLVTSGWHGRRASALLGSALHGSGLEVRLALTDERGNIWARGREAACWTVLPVQKLLARRRRAPAVLGSGA